MSSIQTILSSNTFGEWKDTINDVIDQVNSANSVPVANVFIQYDSAGSFSANSVNLNELTLGNTVNGIFQDFSINNHSSLVTSKAIYDLLTQGGASLKMSVGSIEFPGGVSITGVVDDFPSSRPDNYYDNPITANGVFKLLESNRPETLIDSHFNSFQLGSSNKILRITNDFSTIDASTMATTMAIETYLKNDGLALGVASIRISETERVSGIVNEFFFNSANVSHDKLATTQAVKDFIGGVDTNIGTFEGQSLKIKGHLIDGYTNNLLPINSNTVPTTLGVNTFLTNSTANINANSVVANTTTSQNTLCLNTFTLSGVAINAISLDLSTLNDSTFATTNAIVNYFSSGGAESVSANTVTLQGYSVNSIANVIDAANTNVKTLATTQGIYDLISGGVASVPPLPITANTFSFPGNNNGVVVNAIANVFDTANTNSRTLLTSEAVYEKLRDLSFEARLGRLRLATGTNVSAIHVALGVGTDDDDTLLTAKAIKDFVSSSLTAGVSSLGVDQVEANFVGSGRIETPLIQNASHSDNVTIEAFGTELKVNALGVFINGAAIATV